MLYSLRTTVPATTTPVSLQLARQHARIDHTYDDGLLGIYLQSATALAESYLNRALINRTLTLSFARTQPPVQWPSVYVPIVMPIGYEYLNAWPTQNTLELLRSPIQSVTSVAVGTWGTTDTALVAGTDYDVDLSLDPARVMFYGNSPFTPGHDHITVTYVAGYGPDSSTVPVPIQQAILLMLTASYEHRGDGDGEIVSSTVRSLLDPYRLVTFG